MANYDEHGREIPDPTPVARALGLGPRASTLDEIRAAIGLIDRERAMSGEETFEEADDFDVEEDFDPVSPWEISADNDQALEQLKTDIREGRVYRREMHRRPHAAAHVPDRDNEARGTRDSNASGAAPPSHPAASAPPPTSYSPGGQ